MGRSRNRDRTRRQAPAGAVASEPVLSLAGPNRPRALVLAAISIALLIVTFSAYWKVLSNPFVQYDDPNYVTENTYVLQGLTRASVAHAFHIEYSNWHPVTWLSHMLDVQLFGLEAGKHHRTSLAIHALNVVLLFLLLVWMTKAPWPSAFAAALFAIHPLHVQSVAWISERKDLLSTLFWLLTLAAWLRFVKSRTPAWYGLSLALFSLGLMSKPMIVTLPFTLLLVDIWPLGRLSFSLKQASKQIGGLLFEKAPFFALSAASCVITFIAQKSGGLVVPLEELSYESRVGNAACAYIAYLGKTPWPTSLTAFYPQQSRTVLSWPVAGAFLLLAGITVLVVRSAKRAPYLAFGWFWYLGTLVPVIGLVQVAGQAMADRYTYVPLIGVFIATAWGLADWANQHRTFRYAIAAMAIACLVPLLALTRVQTNYWAGDREMWQHAIEVTSNNYVAENNLGTYYMTQGKTDEAITYYREAVRSAQGYADGWSNLGLALAKLNRTSEAIECFRRAVEINPDQTDGWTNLGLALGKQNRPAEAIECFQREVTRTPGDAHAWLNFGVALVKLNRYSEGIDCFQKALEMNPDYTDARLNLGSALDHENRPSEALEHYELALRTKPGAAQILNSMGLVLCRLNRLPEAIDRFHQALKADPNFADAEIDLAIALDRSSRGPEALEHFQRAVRLKPDSAQTWFYMGLTLGKQDRLSEAKESFQHALKLDPNLADAHYYLGVALLRDKRYAEAREQFVQAERLHPGFGNARDDIDKLDHLLKGKR